MAKKGFSGKYGVTLLTMNAFLRRSNLSKATGNKIAAKIEAAFASNGKPVPVGMSVQKFCILNTDFIKEKAREGALRRTARPAPYAPGYSGDVNADDFLSSYAWRRARMEVLKRDGRRCLCCGTSPEHGAVMHVDHIKPRRLFPQLALDLDNLQVLCAECNHGKGNWDQTDWREPQIDPEIREHLRSIMSD